MRKYKVAVLIGSLRAESYNKKVAQAMMRLAPEQLDMQIVEIGDLPHYNEDLEDDQAPESWQRFREEMQTMDAVFFFTPEYNRSVSAVLKNALDVGSRPYGKSIWDGKPAAVASVSMGALAGAVANHTLRQSLVFLNMPVMQQPEIYIGSVQQLFDDEGKLNEKTEQFFVTIIQAYAKWVEKIVG